MTDSNDDWWQSQIPKDEEVLWFSQPDQTFFPSRFRHLYKSTIVLTVGLWLASPWIIETPWDFWKLLLCTGFFGFVLFGDRYTRKSRYYVVTSQNAWEINKHIKSKNLTIDRFLHFSEKREGVAFDGHPYFSFEHLLNPDAALKALHQAQEATK
ncbi:hypothetical protein [Ruegeria atlantica]|uniref:hypothetical protein n=1 Tax=Ruegeria atlantica TaxID=81569 RepID=UPI00147FC356|nr:hypothetical protein [Ruegeria atlantica]